MVKVISLPYIFHVLYVLCFNRPRYQVSVYRTIGPLVYQFDYYIVLYESKLLAGNVSSLHSGFDGTTKSPSRIALAFYDAMWAYDGW